MIEEAFNLPLGAAVPQDARRPELYDHAERLSAEAPPASSRIDAALPVSRRIYTSTWFHLG